MFSFFFKYKVNKIHENNQFFLFFKKKSDDLLSRMIIKGNTREFLDEYGVENCYTNGKQIHLDVCRKYFDSINSVNSKYTSKSAAKIGDASILLVDDDVQNLKIAHSNGHLAFQVNQNMQLVDLYNFLYDKMKLNQHSS